MYQWATELVPSTSSESVIILLTTFDAGSLAFICLYFQFVSKDWFPLMFFMTILSSVAFIVSVFVLPESPSWLIEQHRDQDAVDALNRIGYINGAKERISLE